MLPRSQRKRTYRVPSVPMDRRWAPATVCCFLDDIGAELDRKLEEMRLWCVEQWRLKQLDDGPSTDDAS